jgi:hypothetical protein
MNNLFNYMQGYGDTRFFGKLWSVPDFEIQPDDEPGICLTKWEQKLAFLRQIQATISTKGFEVVEELLYNYVRQLDNDVAKHIIEQNHNAMFSYAAERQGIVDFMLQFNTVTDKIAEAQEAIKKLTDIVQADPGREDEDLHA